MKKYTISLPISIWLKLEEVAKGKSISRASMIQSSLAALAGMTFAEAEVIDAQIAAKELARVEGQPRYQDWKRRMSINATMKIDLVSYEQWIENEAKAAAERAAEEKAQKDQERWTSHNNWLYEQGKPEITFQEWQDAQVFD
jgi:hypothetical protein